jgi:hypothetical protein
MAGLKIASTYRKNKMNKNTLPVHSGILSLCFIAASAVGAPVQAVTITNLTASASYVMSGTNQVDMGPVFDSSSVDITHFAPDGSGSSIGIHTYADSASASFGSRASGSGIYLVTSEIQVTGTFSGDTFSSTIMPGQIYVLAPSGYPFAMGEAVIAALTFTLVIDGATTFTSSAELGLDSNGLGQEIVETPGGFNIGYALTTGADFAAYHFGASTQSIGGLGAGPHTFEYTIQSLAFGMTMADVCGGGSTGQGGQGGQSGQGACLLSSGAQSGDPLQSLPLPEPGSLALFAAGILGLAWSRLQKHVTPRSCFRAA